MVRAVLLAIAAFALTACYASNRLLLDPDAAVHPIEEGTYVRDGDDTDRFRLTLAPDGWYEVEPFNANGTLGATQRLLVNEQDFDGREGYLLAEPAADGGYLYAIAFLDHGRVFLATPDCSDPLDRDDAVDHGGQPDDEAMTHNCLFQSRSALAAALSQFAGHADFGGAYQRH
ncbi:MAG TPA: hypothetical protein VJP88_00935 [Caulobacteraceae bacterium]|nr:hypothetical protein [Caulobacteraceae bacterium]